MSESTMPEIKEVIDALHYRPSVSIIIPFEPKMIFKAELTERLKSIVTKTERELETDYPKEICGLVIQKLQSLISNLNFNTHKKSVAIYVSPVFEKVLYLDIPVEEKIIINESFEIRDLVFSKKQLQKYLVLLLDEKEFRIYNGNAENFVRIVSNKPESVFAYVNEIPEKVSNFTDNEQRKETIMNKFLHHADNALDIILNAYNLPLFIVGPQRILGHFKSISKHNSAIIEYIEGNYNKSTEQELKRVLMPHITDWKKVKQKEIMNLMDEAMGHRKLATGMKDVWYEATHKKGRLLIVEKNYMYAAEHTDRNDVINEAIAPYNKFSYIKDAVDDVIEKVLQTGGDVEFVDEGMLADFDHIALVQYY